MKITTLVIALSRVFCRPLLPAVLLRKLTIVKAEPRLTTSSPWTKWKAGSGYDIPGLRSNLGSIWVSGKLPTYPFPKLTLTLTSHLGQNFGLRVKKKKVKGMFIVEGALS